MAMKQYTERDSVALPFRHMHSAASIGWLGLGKCVRIEIGTYRGVLFSVPGRVLIEFEFENIFLRILCANMRPANML